MFCRIIRRLVQLKSSTMKNVIRYSLILIILHCANAAQEWSEFYKWNQMEYDHLPDSGMWINKLFQFLKCTKISYCNYNILKVPVFDVEPSIAEIEKLGLYSRTSYIPYNNLPVGVSHYKNRLFITVPRRRVGVPSTLNVINVAQVTHDEKSPKLVAYPSYEINEIPVRINQYATYIYVHITYYVFNMYKKSCPIVFF